MLCSENNSSPVRYLYHVYDGISQLSSKFLDQWQQLENLSLEPNFYLSQDYIIPSIKHLTPEKSMVIIAVEALIDSDQGRTSSLIALGIFEHKSASLHYPFPHLVNYTSTHSLLSGLLIHKDFHQEGFSQIISAIQASSKPWQLIELSYCSEHILQPYLKTLKKRSKLLPNQHVHWHYTGHKSRAILKPESCSAECVEARLSKKRRKRTNQYIRRLKELGDFEWRWVQDDISEKHITDFLSLEGQGWKKETALQSNSSETQFFTEVCERANKKNKLFFTELRVKHKTIASTCNFIQNNYGFAYKLGRDMAYDQYRVGYINEYEAMKNFLNYIPNFQLMESGAEEGSWIEQLWPDTYKLMFGVITLNKYVDGYATIKARISEQKRYLQQQIKAMVPSQT